MGKTARHIIIMLFCILLMAGCKCNKTERSNLTGLDSFITANKKVMLERPDSLISMLEDSARHAPDSVIYYYCKMYIGRCQYYKDDINASIASVDTVLSFCARQHSTPDIYKMRSQCWNIKAVGLQTLNLRKDAMACVNKAYYSVSRADDRREMANICLNGADIERQRGNYPQSMEWCEKGLKACDSLKQDMIRYNIYISFAQNYVDMNDYERSRRYFSMASKGYDKFSDYEKFNFNNSRGNALFAEKDYKAALNCFRRSRQLSLQMQLKSAEAIANGNLAETFINLGMMDSASVCLDKSMSYFSKPDTDDGIRFYLNGLKIDMALRDGRIDEAGKLLAVPFKADKIGRPYMYLFYKRLLEFYTKTRDYEKAFKYKNLVCSYDDSLRNIQQLNRVAEIQYSYKRDTTILKRDLIISNGIEREHNFVFAIVICIVLLILLASLLFMMRYIYKRRVEKRRQEQWNIVAKLKMENVRNRFSPHFIFNVLNIVMPSMVKDKQDEDIMKTLISTIRYNLINSNDLVIPLQNEINMVKHYVELRKVTHRDTTPDVTWDIAQDVDTTQYIPSMIIQIPVENALKHAFPPLFTECPRIHISIKRTTLYNCDIEINDNGIGINSQKTASDSSLNTGNGIKLIMRMTEVMNAANAEHIIFRIADRSVASAQTGTTVTIQIPYNYHFES